MVNEQGKDNEDLLDEIEEKYENESPPRPRGLKMPRTFVYIHYKAYEYLQLGPEKYREIDFFDSPPKDWDQERLERLQQGCKQILDWRGPSPEIALENLGIEGFYDLCQLFHFKVVAQKLVSSDEQTFLDEMQLEHLVDSKKELILYNKVQNPE